MTGLNCLTTIVMRKNYLKIKIKMRRKKILNCLKNSMRIKNCY